MSARATPETDAVWEDKSQNILEHARKLERERDDALHKLSRCMHVLALIASPRRPDGPDGTYNRDRAACERLARETLEAIK